MTTVSLPNKAEHEPAQSEETRPIRQWLITWPGYGRRYCSICGTPERWDMVGICACFEVRGMYLVDTARPGYAPNAAHLSDGRGFVDGNGLTEAI